MHQYRSMIVSCLCASALLLTACSSKTAEEKGKELATEKVDLAKGIGDALQEKGSAAAESVTTGVGKVINGITRGVEKSGRVATLTANAQQAGLQVTKVQLPDLPLASASASSEESTSPMEHHAIDIYVLTSKQVKGTLKIKAFNALGQEIGRSKVALAQGADEAEYLSMPLDSHVDLQAISKVEVDFSPLTAN